MINRLPHGLAEALLGRSIESLVTDDDRLPVAGRRCLITGAGGTIGSELALQLAACDPERLVLVDHAERALFEIERELVERHPSLAIVPVLCDVTRSRSVARLWHRERPHIVLHAAAYKHVTMAERAIAAATRVNVLGTAAIVSASRDVGARLVLISSDKAAAPQSVMGATKRLAEHVTLASATKSFRPIVVRFGNVLGSSGSVVDVMRDRLALGRSILVTDPDATRYFMTVGEAVALVMKAVGVARGGETFWLDMGEQVRVGDLARRLSEWEVSEDRARPAIEVIGLRPGEKRVEQLTDQGLELVPTTASRVLVARQRPIRSVVCPVAWRSLRRAVAAEDALAVLQGLCAMVPDFEPSSQAWAVARAERLHQRPVARARTA